MLSIAILSLLITDWIKFLPYKDISPDSPV